MAQKIVVDGDVDFVALVRLVALELGTPQSHTTAHVQAVLDVIGRSLAEGRKVKLTNFGTFEPAMHTIAAGALGGRVTESTSVKTVRFHTTGRLLAAIRSGASVDTLRKAAKSF